MTESPSFTDPRAFNAPTPAAPPTPDLGPRFRGLGRIGESLVRLGTVLYKNEQEATVLRANIDIARGFQGLVEKAEQSDKWEDIRKNFAEGAQLLHGEAISRSMDEATRGAIEISFERAGLRAEAAVTAQMLEKKAQAFSADATTRAEQLYHEAAIDPDDALLTVKEDFEALAEILVGAGSLTEDRAAAWLISQLAQVDLIKASSIVSASPARGLQMLEEKDDSGAFANFVDLDPLKRLSLIAQAKANTKQRSANVDEIGRQAVFSIFEDIGNGEAQMRALAEAGASSRQMEDWGGRIGAARVAKSYLDRIEIADPAETLRLVKEYNEKVGDLANPFLVTMVGEFRERLAASLRRWMSDPAAEADNVFPPPVAPEGFTMPIAGQVANRNAAYQTKGLPRQNWKPLTTQQAANITQQFKDTPVDERQLYVQEIIGTSAKYADEVVAQLLSKGEGGGHMPPEFLMMHDMSGNNPLASAELSKIIGASEAELRRKYSDPSDATRVSRDMIDLFNENIGRTMPDDPAQSQALRTVAVRLALKMEDAQAAYDLLWGDREIEGSIRWPRGMPAHQKSFFIRHLDDMLGDPQKFGLIPKDAPPERVHALTQTLSRFGRWITYADDTGKDVGVVLEWKDSEAGGYSPWIDASGGMVRIPFSTSFGAPDVPDPFFPRFLFDPDRDPFKTQEREAEEAKRPPLPDPIGDKIKSVWESTQPAREKIVKITSGMGEWIKRRLDPGNIFWPREEGEK